MIEYFGINSIRKLRDILDEKNYKKIFLVTGKNSYEFSSAKKILSKLLKDRTIYRFFEFSNNPKIEDINRGLNLFRKDNYDIILAIGGGSVMDMGKCISIFSQNLESPEKYIKKKVNFENKGTPLICIPTTAGSGSEATHFAVLYIDKQKFSLGHPKYMFPDYSIVDPQFTFSLSKKITASTGMDALSQAIESYWNISSTEESMKYAKKAIILIKNNLYNAVNNPDNQSRDSMARAANYSGKAINITKTTACHAISYPITSYFGVPHGQAVAITLPSLILFNSQVSESDVLDPRGISHVQKIMRELKDLFDVENFDSFKSFIRQLMTDIGLETKLSKLGILSEEDIELIVNHGFNPERVKNNPRKLTETHLRSILKEIA